jgi:predicted TIM-barrel fold metal-dependent hydrolase
VRHPALRMIAAHLGGGLPFYAHMPEVKVAIENIYFDTAACELLYDEDCIARVVDLVGKSRVLFGSDYPLLSPRRQIKRVQTLLPGGFAQAVCGGNADTLLWEQNDS